MEISFGVNLFFFASATGSVESLVNLAQQNPDMRGLVAVAVGVLCTAVVGAVILYVTGNPWLASIVGGGAGVVVAGAVLWLWPGPPDLCLGPRPEEEVKRTSTGSEGTTPSTGCDGTTPSPQNPALVLRLVYVGSADVPSHRYRVEVFEWQGDGWSKGEKETHAYDDCVEVIRQYVHAFLDKYPQAEEPMKTEEQPKDARKIILIKEPTHSVIYKELVQDTVNEICRERGISVRLQYWTRDAAAFRSYSLLPF